MSQEPRTPDVLDDAQKGMVILFAVARTWAISLEVFLHRDLGTRYPGMPGVFVLLFVPAYGCCWGGHDLRPLLAFLALYFFVCIGQRLNGLRRTALGLVTGHSYYTGTPCVWRLFPSLSEKKVKQLVEPAMVIAAGAACTFWNQPLGVYLIGGAFSLLLSDGLHEAMRNQQAMDMNDAVIEQQLLAERFRKLRGED